MGFAEDSDDEEFTVEATDHNNYEVEQLKLQVTNLTEAMTKLKFEKTASSDTQEGEKCLMNSCGRDVDWYCRYCKASMCTKCSKKPCGNQAAHNITDFDDMYESCKKKFTDWKEQKESTVSLLTSHHEKVQGKIAKYKQQMEEATSEEVMSKLSTKLFAKKKMLGEVTRQLSEAKSSLSSYGNVDSLSNMKFIRVLEELDLTNRPVIDLRTVAMSQGCGIITEKTCYDIEVIPNGDLLFAGNRGFDVCDASGQVVRSVKTSEGDFTSIQYYKGRVYTLLKEPKGSDKRRIVVFDPATYTEIKRWELPAFGFVSMMAVSNDKLYAVDANNQKILVYSLVGVPVTEFQHSTFQNPVYMCPCAPDGVLVCDWSAGLIYKINSGSDKIEWSYAVDRPRGVFCDKYGNVWVWSSSMKKFYVRASDGKQTISFLNPALVANDVEFITGMTLANSSLWVATCSKGVMKIPVRM